jgi:hypothetical protein
MIYSKRGFRNFMIISSFIFSLFSPTLQSLISNRGEWPGLAYYPVTEFFNPAYWLQMLAFLLYGVAFYFITHLVISCEYYSTKVSNFISGWFAGVGIFFLTSWLLDFRGLDLHGDILWRSMAMGFVALMFGELILKRLREKKICPEDVLPKYFLWLCEALPIYRNER